ncbi:MAG TPA: TonB-dependent receptor [Bacteroides sp.]|nr:TonB-dependent receptor [Bacteroides sp.]
MKKNKRCLSIALPIILAALLLGISFSTSAQVTVRGVIIDDETGEKLVGATIVLKETSIGTVTNTDGEFELTVQESLPITVVISYVGYVSQELYIDSPSQEFNISLNPDAYLIDDVVVTGSRLSEKQKESPLTVESMDIISIKETPSANFYDGLGMLKGVDLTAASIGFKIVNTRGFNSTSPVRSLQIIDGVDNQAPGLNFSLGNFLGASELDLQKVEIIAGASTAMYGPNAFNGVIKMTTKDPFLHQGLIVMAKAGERNLLEGVFRYARVFRNREDKDKLALKFNLSFMRADDWEATNLNATEQSLVDPANPGGYDAVNVYGDGNMFGGTSDYSDLYGQSNYPGLGIFYRTGYHEKDIVDYDSRNLKIGSALYYKLTAELVAQYSYFLGTGTTVYQGDNRYSLKDIVFQQHKFELSKPGRFFIRAYTTREDAGNSYDAVFTAQLLQEAAKPNDQWPYDYSTYYIQNVRSKVKALPGFPDEPPLGVPYDYEGANLVMEQNIDSINKWHMETRQFADGPGTFTGNSAFLEPGTEGFDTVFNRIISSARYLEGGSGFKDKSALSHIHGEYKISEEIIDIVLGGSYRLYNPNSSGTIFSDTGGVVITNYEYGLYTSLEKRFFERDLIVTATARLDKNENFNFLLSPAVSVVYRYDANKYFRLSFSSAIRNPTLQDQYLFYNLGPAILVGNINGFDSLVTFPSLRDYYSKLNRDTLNWFNVPPVRPEKVKTIEIGFKGTLFYSLFIDASYYFSFYRDFLGFKLGSDLEFDPGTGILYDYQHYRVSANSPDMITTQGFSIGINYYFRKYYSLITNYSFNRLDRRGSTDPIIPAFNTPENKFNIGLSGRDIIAEINLLNRISDRLPVVYLKNCGFYVNYKWQQGFLFEGSPQFTGHIPAYGMMDVQLNYRLPKISTTFKIGASNILDNRVYQTYGGPFIGRLAYASVLVELDKGIF